MQRSCKNDNDLLLRRRFLAATSTTLAVAHVPDLASFAVGRCVKACPLVFGTVACSSFARRLVVAAFVPAVVGSASDYGHVELLSCRLWSCIKLEDGVVVR
jgi:hypothetical protein